MVYIPPIGFTKVLPLRQSPSRLGTNLGSTSEQTQGRGLGGSSGFLEALQQVQAAKRSSAGAVRLRSDILFC